MICMLCKTLSDTDGQMENGPSIRQQNFKAATSLCGPTVILNDPLDLLDGECSERPLVRRPHLVREHDGGVHHAGVQQLDGAEVGLEAVAHQDVAGGHLEQQLGLHVPQRGAHSRQVRLLDAAEPAYREIFLWPVGAPRPSETILHNHGRSNMWKYYVTEC